MSRSPFHRERHKAGRAAWLRACVLGANDGIVSTASLVMGVAAASASRPAVLLAGTAGLVAGALSMAAGEYVSVRSQADAEAADLDTERAELAADGTGELAELTTLYVRRGLDPWLAHEVAVELTRHDALGAHARDELGLHPAWTARPYQAAVVSAGSFAAGAALPLAVVVAAPAAQISALVVPTTLLALGVLGAGAARLGGAPPMRGALRVVVWGAAAMLVTGLAGALVPLGV